MRFRIRPIHWFILAAAIRVLAAFTRVNWHYPDEWYQTAEFSQLILGKAASYTHEMGLHLRNLSWPAILAIPTAIADFLDPHWTQLRLILCQLTAGALDLAAIWAFSRLSRGWPSFWRNAGFAILVIPWFTVQDSVSLGAEHVCMCLIWLALAFFQERRFSLAGFFSIALFAAKYPAGLVTLGFGIAVLVNAIREKKVSPTLFFTAGCVAGLVVFGAADWIYYGRPWESLWMYLQYNVLTGAGVMAYGKQSLYPYFDFLQYRWLRVLLPIGIGLIACGSCGLFRDIKKAEPWAFAFCAYFLGHLLVAHREARFMLPAETLLVWGALKFAADRYSNWKPRGWVAAVLGLSLIANFPLVLKAAIAETGTLNSTYFEIDRRLQENPNACAVISQRTLDSLILPTSGKTAYGFFPAERRKPTFPQSALKPLAWFQHGPQCSSTDTVLLLVDRPDVSWVERGCRLQSSGILELLPQGLWITFLHRGWVSGPWYACPSSVLSDFKTQVQEEPFVDHFVRFEKLPPFGISADELVAFGKNHEAPHTCRWTCL